MIAPALLSHFIQTVCAEQAAGRRAGAGVLGHRPCLMDPQRLGAAAITAVSAYCRHHALTAPRKYQYFINNPYDVNIFLDALRRACRTRRRRCVLRCTARIACTTSLPRLSKPTTCGLPTCWPALTAPRRACSACSPPPCRSCAHPLPRRRRMQQATWPWQGARAPRYTHTYQ